MAAVEGKSPVILTAVGDYIGGGGKHWCVTCIRFVASASGQFILTDVAGGREIARSSVMNAGDAEDISFDGHWFDGIYMSQGDGRVYVYYK